MHPGSDYNMGCLQSCVSAVTGCTKYRTALTSIHLGRTHLVYVVYRSIVNSVEMCRLQNIGELDRCRLNCWLYWYEQYLIVNFQKFYLAEILEIALYHFCCVRVV